MLDQVPGLRLDVAEHASRDEYLFIRWIARCSGAEVGVHLSGVDRIRLRDGLVKENRIYYDPALFDALASEADGRPGRHHPAGDRPATPGGRRHDRSRHQGTGPLTLLALGTGVVLAAGTKWGLLRHYWVLVKLASPSSTFGDGRSGWPNTRDARH